MPKEQMTQEELEAKKKAAKERWSTKPKEMEMGSGGAMMPTEEVDEGEMVARTEREKEVGSK